MKEQIKTTTFLTYGLSSFSFSQILGLLVKGFAFQQGFILLTILCLICLIPGFLRYGIMQRDSIHSLKFHNIFSCFVPSLIGISVLVVGFFVGCYISF